MKTYVIYCPEFDYSVQGLNIAVESAAKYGIEAIPFVGVNAFDAHKLMTELGIRPNPTLDAGRQGLLRSGGVQGCFMSHYKLWNKCVELNEPIMVFEHDCVVIRDIPDFDFVDVLDLDPFRVLNLDTSTLPKDVQVRSYRDLAHIQRYFPVKPFGMIGTQAYMIKPHAAKAVIEATYRNGFSPADDMLNSAYLTVQYTDPQVTSVTIKPGGDTSLCADDKMWNNIR